MFAPWTRWVCAIGLLGAALSMGCVGAAPVTILVPTIQIESGNDQSAEVGTELALPFVVVVKDANQEPVAGVDVVFAVESGGGSLSAMSATTDALGQAHTTLTVGAMAGSNTVTASAPRLGRSPVTFKATGTAPTSTTAVMFSTHVKPILDANCASCHQPGGSASFTPLTSYTLVRYGNSLSGGAPLVVAGDASSGVLVQKIDPTGTMYSSLGADTTTRDANGKTIRDWIAQGALNTPVGPATQVALVSGDNQSATISTALPTPLVVRVTDANDNPVSGVTVEFAVSGGGGSLSVESATTDAVGEAKSVLTVGATAGANSVTASVAGLASSVAFTATATIGTAAQIALVSGNNQSAPAGAALLEPFVVAVKDAGGNPISGFMVTFAVVTGSGSLSAATVETSASGLAQTTLTLGTTAGTTTVYANATGLTGSPVTFTATGTAGPATELVLVSGNNQSTAVGTALAEPLVIAVTDANGNPIAGVDVTFAVTSGGGSLSATSVTTNAVGQAQTALTVGTTAGTNTVTASRAGLTGSPVTFMATATTGTATQIAVVSGNNQSATVGTTINPFVVAVKDANGNPVTGFVVTFAVATGTGMLSATTATTNALGQAQTTLTLGNAAGTNTVTANAAGLTGSPVTFTAIGKAGAATQIALVSGNNQTARVGSALAMPLAVAAKDANGNPVAGVAVTFAVASGGGSLSATSVTTNTTGQAQSTLTVGASAGSNTVTASAAGLTGSPVAFTATARWLTYEDDVQPILVAKCVNCHMPGGQASFTPLTNYTEVRYGVSFFSGAALVVPNSPASSLLVQKTQSTGSMYVHLGADAVTRDANAKTINDWIAQGSFNSAVGPATQITMTSGNDQSAPGGTTLSNPLVVTVMDAKLNPVSGFTVRFAVTQGGGSVSPTSVATNAQGAAATTLTLGTSAGTNSVTASATGLTNSPITFTATATAGAYSGAPLTGSSNPFDVAALVALKAANVEPAPVSSDGEFLRRVTADLAGRLPTVDEWTAFAASTDPLKREQAIDRLLASTDFGNHWGRDILAAWLVVEKDSDNVTNVANFEAYLIDAANTDKPLSTVVSELARGAGTGGVAFDSINMVDGDRHMAADRLMETFTGIPTKCSRCHDSKITGPLDDPKWTMAQNYGLYKFFEVDAGEFSYYDTTLQKRVNPAMMFVVDGVSTNPTSLPQATDSLAVRRARFAELLVASKAFPRGTGHRIFAEVMAPLLDSNRLLAQQIADVKVPEVLKASTSVFTSQGTSLKGYLRVLMRSKVYQLTTQGTTTAHDAILARRTLRRHAAEVLQAGIVAVTGVADTTSARNDFLSKFGYPMDRETITERSYAINTIQPLTLLNNNASVPGKVTQSTFVSGLATRVDGGTITLDAAITEIFQRALTRNPTATELADLKTELASAATTKEKLEDVAAVVMASIEFAAR